MLGCAYVFLVGKVVAQPVTYKTEMGTFCCISRVMFVDDNDHKNIFKVIGWGWRGKKLLQFYQKGRTLAFLGKLKANGFKAKAGLVNETEISVVEFIEMPSFASPYKREPEGGSRFTSKEDKVASSIFNSIFKNALDRARSKELDDMENIDEISKDLSKANDEDFLEEKLGDQVIFSDEWGEKKWDEKKENYNQLRERNV